MTLLIIYALISIVFSFLCSIMEAVLLSITPSYVNRQVRDNPTMGKRLQEYKKDIDKPLSAILTLNTIAHTVGAILVGSQASSAFGEIPVKLPFVDYTFPMETLVAVIMTLAILILSEIIPKTLGANFWRKLTPFTMTVLRIIMFLLYPLVWLSKLITRYLKSSDVHSVLSREDYRAMTDLGGVSGALEVGETEIISNLLNLDDLRISDIMTPRSVIHTANQEMTLQEYYDAKKDSPFSRIPIFKDRVEDLTGFVLKEEIMKGIIDGKGAKKLSDLQRKVAIVQEDKSLKDFFKYMETEGQHLAVVTNEFGTIAGVVTLEDVIETLLGFEIVDESDNVQDLQAYARQKWQERAKKVGLID